MSRRTRTYIKRSLLFCLDFGPYDSEDPTFIYIRRSRCHDGQVTTTSNPRDLEALTRGHAWSAEDTEILLSRLKFQCVHLERIYNKMADHEAPKVV